MAFEYDNDTAVTDAKGLLTTPWRAVFSRWHTIIMASQQSGTTAQRPINLIWIGRRYFDTTLGKPVFVKSYAAGVVAWVDGAGVVS